MNRIFVIILGLFLFGSREFVQAQTPSPSGSAPQVPTAGNGEIRGVVVDAETKTPVSAASVAVWSEADTTLVAGAVVRQDGSFRIEGLRLGTYYLKVSAPGYTTNTIHSLTLTAASPRANAESISLVRSAVSLEGLVVTGERTAISIAPDRNTYQVKDIAPAGGTAADVLQGVPSVQVDLDGKVSFRGNENIVVQINGRPSPMQGTQLASYLRQLPSSMLERVEVVPNPSAKYDPEGMAGIINIVLKQNVDLGLSGGLTMAASTADRNIVSGNIGYQNGPLTAFLAYGYNLDERSVTGLIDRKRLGVDRIPLSFTEQGIRGDESTGGHNLNSSLDYRFSNEQVLSTTLFVNHRSTSSATMNEYNELDDVRFLLSRYNRSRETETENLMVDYTLGYRRTMKPQRHEFSAEVRFNRSDDQERIGLLRQLLTLSGEKLGAPLEMEAETLDALTSQATAQADYTRTLSDRTKLETGYKGNVRWLNRDYQLRQDPLGAGSWMHSDLSNSLNLNEQVQAAYVVLSQGVAKFEMQAGLRGEYAWRDFSLRDGNSFPHHQGSFFPSGLVSYTVDDATQVKLSYSRRIRRPSSGELNPFPVFADLQNVFFGNPKLSPEYTDAFEFGFQRSWQRGSLQVSPFYRRMTDIIRFSINAADTVAGREVTSLTFKNLRSARAWGSDANGSLRLGQRFNGLANFGVVKLVTDGGNVDSNLSSDAIIWYARVNGSLNLNPKTAIQAMYLYRAPMKIERGRYSSSTTADISLRRQLSGDKASVSLRVSDPFNTMRFRLQGQDDYTTQIIERKFNTRALYLTFQYNFGQAPKIRQRRPEIEQPVGFQQ